MDNKTRADRKSADYFTMQDIFRTKKFPPKPPYPAIIKKKSARASRTTPSRLLQFGNNSY
jgi:hypothetical protein